jgi:hypothetical protein
LADCPEDDHGNRNDPLLDEQFVIGAPCTN